jgi:molybdopterin-guanine dinucleotide biosynthesis protein A
MAAPAIAIAPYLALLSLTRCERDLIAAGDWQGVATLGAQRAEVVATLPADAPADARALVDEALALMQANLATAVATRDRTRATLAHMAEGRRALHAYAGTREAGSVDTRS